MQGERILQTIHVPGTLAANIRVIWTTSIPLKLIHISSVNTVAASNALIIVGYTGSTAAYLASVLVGNNSVPTEHVLANFVGAAYPHIPAGTVMEINVDFDGSAGTACANLTVVLTYEEG